jgi:hypothetical protein
VPCRGVDPCQFRPVRTQRWQSDPALLPLPAARTPECLFPTPGPQPAAPACKARRGATGAPGNRIAARTIGVLGLRSYEPGVGLRPAPWTGGTTSSLEAPLVTHTIPLRAKSRSGSTPAQADGSHVRKRPNRRLARRHHLSKPLHEPGFAADPAPPYVRPGSAADAG